MNQEHTNLPASFKDDLIFINEALLRGIAKVDDINTCLKEKYEGQETTTLLQVMLKKRVISIDSFMTINKSVTALSQDQLKERFENAPKITVVLKNKVPFIDLKAGFQKIGKNEIVKEIGQIGRAHV